MACGLSPPCWLSLADQWRLAAPPPPAASRNALTHLATSVPTIAIQPYVDPVTGLVNQVSEGNSRTKAITFLATLSSPSASTVTASYLTQSFDPYATGAAVATAQRDYRTASKTITFAPGEVQKPFTISIVGDRSKEANEVFGIGLQQANGGVFSGNADSTWIAMTILNDDLA